MTRIEKGAGWELRLGDYREVLAGVTCDAVITDPPYSERMHAATRIRCPIIGQRSRTAHGPRSRFITSSPLGRAEPADGWRA